MICSNCQYQILDNAKFCPNCGCVVPPPPSAQDTDEEYGEIVCSACHQAISAEAKVCPHCGSAVIEPMENGPMICSGCHSELPDNVKFCPHCGTSVLGASTGSPHYSVHSKEIVKMDIKTPLIINGEQFRVNRSSLGLVLGIASIAFFLLTVISAFLCFVPFAGLLLLPAPALFALVSVACGGFGIYFGYQYKKNSGSYLQAILSVIGVAATLLLTAVSTIIGILGVIALVVGGFALLFLLLIIMLLGA